ncbi:MAG TPA: HD domain-containing phosphohydrolase [Solirubrobacteraceae bacterium]|nr:HD domain-containing phosphohydrolase [Solirubrobacteraceae bacterium]
MWLADAPRLRRVVLAYSLSELGGWFAMVALPLAIYSHTHSSLAVGGLLAAGSLPAALAPAIVARVEMMERRGGIALLFLIAGVAAGLLALLLWHFWLPVIFPVFALQNGATFAGVAMLRAEGVHPHNPIAPQHHDGDFSLHLAARQVPPGDYPDATPADEVDTATPHQETIHRANAAFNLAMSLAMVIGPATAGLAVTALHPPLAMLIAAAALAAAAAPILSLDLYRIRDTQTTVRALLAQAANHLRSSPHVGPLLRAEALALLFFTAVVPLDVAYSKSTLRAGAAGYAALIGVWGAGMIAGSITFARYRRPPARARSRLRPPPSLSLFLSVGTAAVALAYIGFFAAPALPDALIAAFAGGAGNGIQWAAFLGIVQVLTPRTLLARTMAATEALRATTPFLGVLFGGVLATVYSTRVAFLIAGAGTTGALAFLVRTVLKPLMSDAPSDPTLAPARTARPATPTEQVQQRVQPKLPISPRSLPLTLIRLIRSRHLYYAVSLALLLGAIIGAIITARATEWERLPLLAILTMLLLTGELIQSIIQSKAYSAGFLAIAFAACLLGPAPAVAFALLAAIPATRERRRALRYWLANLSSAAIAAFAAASLLRLVIVHVYHTPVDRLLPSISFAPAIFAVPFIFDTLNTILISWSGTAFWQTPMRTQLRTLLLPTLPVQAALGLMAAIVVIGYARIGLPFWILAFPALIAFQHLAVQLVRSGSHLDTLQRATPADSSRSKMPTSAAAHESGSHAFTSSPLPTSNGSDRQRSSFPPRKRLGMYMFYSCTSILAGGSLTLAAITTHSYEWTPLALFALLAGLAFFGEQLQITIHGQPLAASFVAYTLAMVLLGPAPAVAIGVATMVYTSARRRLAPRFWLANIAIHSTYLYAGAALAQSLAGNVHSQHAAHADRTLAFAEIVFLVFMVSMLLNFVLISIAARILWRRRFADQFRELFLPVLPAQLALGVLTTLAAIAYMNFGVSILLGGILLLALFQYLMTRLVRSEDRLAQLVQEALHRATMEIGALSFTMRSLNARLSDSGRHAAAVALYAEELLRHLDRPEFEQHVAHAAGLFHDIGMTAVPDHIFESDKGLDVSDWDAIRRHPIDGSHLISQFPDYRAAADAIMSHHERWDGTGYPDGLIGGEIPFLARVLAICEAYDVMTAASSYACIGDSSRALEEIRANSGSQFDPELAEAFIALRISADDTVIVNASLESELDKERRILIGHAKPSPSHEPPKSAERTVRKTVHIWNTAKRLGTSQRGSRVGA